MSQRFFIIVGIVGWLIVLTGNTIAATADKIPSFDVVRVDRSGIAVLAGRGPANARIDIVDGNTVLGSVYSSRDGEWVVILDGILTPGSHRLNLIAVLEGGQIEESEHELLLVVPDNSGLPVRPKTLPQITPSKPKEPEPKLAPQAKLAPEIDSNENSRKSEAIVIEKNPPKVVEEKESKTVVALLLTKKPGGATRLLQKPEPAKGLSHFELSIDKVDFDEQGKFEITGSGAAGTTTRIYVDNELIATVLVDEKSRWLSVPNQAVSTGTHLLRVDQIGDDGQVSARIEVPFAPQTISHEMLATLDKEAAENASADAGSTTKIVVKPGQNLWQIARQVYGEGTKYTVIYQANKSQIRDPTKLYPGQVLELPKQ